jgi:hypothetical protein
MPDNSVTRPNLGVTSNWANGDEPYETKMNQNWDRLDTLIQCAVFDKDLTAPPGSPTAGDRYLVAASATGAWATHDGEVAVYLDGAWRFFAPKEGWLVWVADENLLYDYNGSAWEVFTPPSGGGTAHNVLSATHSDSTAGSVVRGDLIVGKGASPKWERLALGANGKYLKSDGNDVTWADAPAGGGGGGTGYLFFETLYGSSGQTNILGSGTTSTASKAVSGGSDGVVTTVFVVPHDWDALSSIHVYYCNGGISANPWLLKAGFRDFGDGDLRDAAITYGAESTITPPTTTNEIDVVSLGLPSEAWSPGDVIAMTLMRAATAAGDTNTSSMEVIGVRIGYTRA